MSSKDLHLRTYQSLVAPEYPATCSALNHWHFATCCIFLASLGSQAAALYSIIGLTRALYARSLDLAAKAWSLRRRK